ncbi:uncharacterized protein A4U43_C10F19430 [Asparagus officinalis]|uniref:ALOG domain-containing protein n=1 Tax=Asparagus officinalis TaxID=4686 RepID=A0A5P1E421_ASPOF|nr:uncharacterized protein A4U43_C10F19430 [Asparagus officinalis]
MDYVHPHSNSPLKYTTRVSPPPSSDAEPPYPASAEAEALPNTFNRVPAHCRPPLPLALCSGAHVLEFLKYLDQFGKTRVHSPVCPFFGQPSPPSPCPCPLKQAWGSLDSVVGRLRAAFEENGGRPENNPFGSGAVRMYLKEIRDFQERARGDCICHAEDHGGRSPGVEITEELGSILERRWRSLIN